MEFLQMPVHLCSHCCRLPLAILLLSSLDLAAEVRGEGPYQATGFKVGEVTDSTAIVWTRLTRNTERNSAQAPMVSFETKKQQVNNKSRKFVSRVVYPKGSTVADIQYAVPGAAGQVRVKYRVVDTPTWNITNWQAVETDRDFVRHFQLNRLKSNTKYDIQVQSKPLDSDRIGQTLAGHFHTAPASDETAKVVFTVSTGQAFKDRDNEDGYVIYPLMLDLQPQFFVHTGDIVYYDTLAKTLELARYHWQRTYSLPTNVQFHNNVSSYFIKDDHDTWQNDSWPTMDGRKMFQFTFKQGLATFKEQVPMSDSTYRTRRWGRDLQIWMVEGRDFRSPNTDSDGPGKTIWGREQKEWLKRTVEASNATFKILISPTPIVGPDRENKHDNHSNIDFTHEGDEVREFIAKQKNMVVVCGDRHWQYMSIHPKTGVREYSCGPASDSHAGGWQQDDFRQDYHRYLNVIGGFLSCTVERDAGTPKMTFRFHDSKGKIRYSDTLVK
jgi:alkaline phosphatase D